MHRKQSFLPFFLTYFGLSLLLLLLGSTGIFKNLTSFVNKNSQLPKDVVYILTLRNFQNENIKKLSEENMNLKKKLSEEKIIINENIALKSQFELTTENSKNLLPAKVIGFPGFIPGVSLPDYLIIDKGLRSGVLKGDAIVSNNFLVGKIVETYPDFSRVELITNEKSTFTSKVANKKDLNGVIRGQGKDQIILDNVLLNQEIKKGDDVLTKGDKNEKGKGYPPDLMVGKIVNVEKNQSDLFQRAEVISPIDFKNLELVFVMQVSK